MKNMKYPLFGDHLKWQREFHKITQAEIAKKLNVDTHTVSNWECGLYLPPRNKIRALAESIAMHESELAELRERAIYQKQYDKLESQGSFVPFKGFAYSRSQFPVRNTQSSSESSLNNLITLDHNIELKPKDILKNHSAWKGPRFKFAPPTDRFYIFTMPDRSMEPKFAPGDALLVDTQIQKDIGTVVIKLKRSDQMCRIASKDGQNMILRALNTDVKEPVKIVKKRSDFEWIYPVVGFISKSV